MAGRPGRLTRDSVVVLSSVFDARVVFFIQALHYFCTLSFYDTVFYPRCKLSMCYVQRLLRLSFFHV